MSLLSRGLPICTALAMILGGAAAFAETSLIGGVSQKDYKGATGAPAGAALHPSTSPTMSIPARRWPPARCGRYPVERFRT